MPSSSQAACNHDAAFAWGEDQAANAAARRSCKPLKPLPSEIGPQYVELFNRLLDAEQAVRTLNWQISLLITSRDHQQGAYGDLPFCKFAVAELTKIIDAATAERDKQRTTIERIQNTLDALFRVWCEKRGTKPEHYQ